MKHDKWIKFWEITPAASPPRPQEFGEKVLYFAQNNVFSARYERFNPFLTFIYEFFRI